MQRYRNDNTKDTRDTFSIQRHQVRHRPLSSTSREPPWSVLDRWYRRQCGQVSCFASFVDQCNHRYATMWYQRKVIHWMSQGSRLLVVYESSSTSLWQSWNIIQKHVLVLLNVSLFLGIILFIKLVDWPFSFANILFPTSCGSFFACFDTCVARLAPLSRVENQSCCQCTME